MTIAQAASVASRSDVRVIEPCDNVGRLFVSRRRSIEKQEGDDCYQAVLSDLSAKAVYASRSLLRSDPVLCMLCYTSLLMWSGYGRDLCSMRIYHFFLRLDFLLLGVTVSSAASAGSAVSNGSSSSSPSARERFTGASGVSPTGAPAGWASRCSSSSSLMSSARRA